MDNSNHNGGGTSVLNPFPPSPTSRVDEPSPSPPQFQYPKIAQDGPVDRYIQQLPSDGNDFFSTLFLPPEFPLDNSAQNPLKLSYSDPNLQAKLLKTQGARKRRQPVRQELTVEEAKLAALPNEERVKQTRLLKNRQAAQQFRKRQKTHIIELENQVETLTSDNNVLVSRMEMLSAENKLIKEQLEYMRNFVMNCLQLSFPPNTSLQDLQRFGQLAGHSIFPPTPKLPPPPPPQESYQKQIPPIGTALGNHPFFQPQHQHPLHPSQHQLQHQHHPQPHMQQHSAQHSQLPQHAQHLLRPQHHSLPPSHSLHHYSHSGL